jgi:pimeloyl-ACP methyl ester carboxylesterase
MNNHKEVIYTINGQRIHAHEEGPENAQVALMIHGWSSSWYAMSPLLPILSRRYRCVVVDLPGFGESPRMSQRATIPAYAELITQLVQEVTDRPVVFVGHSMGGMISLNITLKQPELVERLILIGPTITGRLSLFITLFISPITFVERLGWSNAIVSRLEPLFLGITDGLMRPSQFAQQTNIREADYHRLRADARRRGQGRIRSECYRAMRDNNLRGKLRDIKTPALVIWGLEDNTVPLRDASVLAQEWPEADLRFIPNAGHWPHFETPLLIERYVRAFLNTPIKLLTVEF